MTTWQDWWDRLLGRDRPEPPSARPPVKPREPEEPKSADTLELAETPDRARPSKRGGGGFDPYANDAGFSKPRGWERVDRE